MKAAVIRMDSGLDAALGFSRASGIPYGIGLIKNKYIGRTFIAPDHRLDQVKIKLSAIEDVAIPADIRKDRFERRLSE